MSKVIDEEADETMETAEMAAENDAMTGDLELDQDDCESSICKYECKYDSEIPTWGKVAIGLGAGAAVLGIGNLIAHAVRNKRW